MSAQEWEVFHKDGATGHRVSASSARQASQVAREELALSDATAVYPHRIGCRCRRTTTACVLGTMEKVLRGTPLGALARL